MSLWLEFHTDFIQKAYTKKNVHTGHLHDRVRAPFPPPFTYLLAISHSNI